MSVSFILTAPVYWVNKKKTKKDTVHLLGMNWYRNAHYHSKNKAKAEVADIIRSQLVGVQPVTNKYKVTYVYYYKSKVSDLMNVVSLTSKIVNDVLQEEGIVINDNIQYCVEERALVGLQDKENPRCVIKIQGL